VREVRVEQEVIGYAIVDAINTYIRDVLIPRCPQLGVLWNKSDNQEELDRLKYEVADTFAAKWSVSQVNDEL
jgi:hypothetical protein